MPAYLVEMPDVTGLTLHEGANKMVVFAADVTSAHEACEAHFPGTEAWVDLAVVTEIVAGANLSGYQFQVTITGAAGQSTDADFTALGGNLNIAVEADPAPIVNAAGATYSDDEIATLVGGVFTRAATVRITGETGGAVDTVEVVDPGEYTTLPGPTAVVTSGGGNSAMTLDIITSAASAFEVLMGQMVTLLNSHPDITGAGVDMSEGAMGARLFTFSDGGGGDDLGDADVTVRFGFGAAGDVSSLKGTITDAGATTAVTSMALPTVAGLVLPSAPTPVKG